MQQRDQKKAKGMESKEQELLIMISSFQRLNTTIKGQKKTQKAQIILEQPT
jgi:hypothetical protein